MIEIRWRDALTRAPTGPATEIVLPGQPTSHTLTLADVPSNRPIGADRLLVRVRARRSVQGTQFYEYQNRALTFLIPSTAGLLLKEDGGRLLKEDGGAFLQEAEAP